jgi:putative tricarboxylic transport membrane protein
VIFENAWEALLVVADPMRFAFIILGVLIGLIVGVIPGIGGLVGLALVLPFTVTMDHFTALGFLIGLSAVTVTSDTIPAVLFGVPGTVGSAATVLDGHPMARRGEAGRAFGAAFSASVLGGLFGALLLGVSVPVLRPFMLSVGTPELLAICALGLTLVAALSGGAIQKGLVAACIGILLAQVGDEPQSGEMRWSGDSLYLLEGFPLVPIALAMFAIPELIDLAISRMSVAPDGSAGQRWQQLQGIRDTLDNWWLVIKCSAIGSLLGSIPGIGAAIIDWIAYGYAARTEKGAAQTFGTGDVRGVIASESSNNAKEGGALVPTLAFGVPGSASMALLLGAFLMHGITPGPKLLTEQLDITYTLVWSIALANIVGAGLCFAFADQFAKIALLRAGILVPMVLAITYIGAYQGSRDFNDLIVLVAFGLIAWVMKRQGWPRPPVILGFVLGDLIEGYMFISYNRYKFEWLLHPGVVIIGTILILVLLRPFLSRLWNRQAPAAPAKQIERTPGGQAVNALLWALATAIFVYVFYSSQSWPFVAKLMPQVVAGIGIVVIASVIIKQLIGRRVLMTPAVTPTTAGGGDAPKEYQVKEPDPLDALSINELLKRSAAQAAWLIGFALLIYLIGILPATLIFVPAYMIIEGGMAFPRAALISAIYVGAMFLLFDRILHMPWPNALIGDIWPALRDVIGLRLV